MDTGRPRAKTVVEGEATPASVGPGRSAVLGRWLQQQQKLSIWAGLLPAQQERLTRLGMPPAEAPSPAPAAAHTEKGPSKAQQAFQRGLAALAQWIERDG
ncbi:hypothetical protein ACFWAX_38765 [Streptomyces sp. NPDC059956]|uniref:hypothetical protein n=1 Tax=Streptomyces sp. NPDC059956 TaxID=3347015 RepID=UPI00366943F2